MLITRKARRSARSRPARPAYRPGLEAFERRELLAASPFLQGTVFADPFAAGTLTAQTTPLAGAKVSLFGPGGTTALASVITGADGGYSFDNTNVAGGLTPGVTYKLVETPPTGFASTGAQALSQVDPASVLSSNSIQVTVVDPNLVVANFQGLASPLNVGTYSVTTGSTTFNSPLTSFNQLNFNLSGAPGVLGGSFATYCVDATDDLKSPGSFAVTVVPQSAMPNGGRVAYLFNHYGTPGVTAASFPAAIQGYSLKNLLAGVQIAIWDLEYNDGAASGAFNLTGRYDPLTSDADYTQIQAAAAALVADSAGKSEKVAILDASLTGVVPSPAVPNLPTGSQSVLAAESFNFYNAAAAGLSGTVYADPNRNLTLDAGDFGISGVTVTLTGTANGQPITPIVTQTNGIGQYSFPTLAPGTYTVTETQPAPFYHEGQTIGSTGGTAGTRTLTTTLVAGANSVNNNFAEIVPNGQITGTVFVDGNGDCLQQPTGEPGIQGVLVTLTGTVDGVPIAPIQLTTDQFGRYAFTNLAPGTYTVTEAQPTGFVQGMATPGSTGGTASGPDAITTTLTIPASESINNNFCETLPVAPGSLSGVVFHDTDNDGVKDSGEGPLPGVTLTLTGAVNGSPVTRTTTTDSNGAYSFTNLAPGTYTVTEAQPSGYLDGLDSRNGTVLAGSRATDAVPGIVVAANANSPANNFGELRPGSISGVVFHDADNDGCKENGEGGLGGVTLTLTGTNDLGASVTATTLTGPDGAYSFGGLRPGTYKLTEAQPAGYLDGLDSKAGAVLAGSRATDFVSGIVVSANSSSPGNNFGEILAGKITGTVYVDDDNDGYFDSGSTAIEGVKLTLTGTNDLGVAVTLTATTDEDGFYSFGGLRPGTYKVAESQPEDFLDGLDSRNGVVITGSNATDFLSGIAITPGSTASRNNFGERLETCHPLAKGHTATIGFWHGKNGQALIKGLNGGPGAKNLGHWLAATYPNLYGSLAGKTNTQVAGLFLSLYGQCGPKADAQVLATALAVYVTDSDLAGGRMASSYGFKVSTTGTGSSTYDFGNSLACYGGPTGKQTIGQILALVNSISCRGNLANGDCRLTYLINCVFADINETGDIC